MGFTCDENEFTKFSYLLFGIYNICDIYTGKLDFIFFNFNF